MAYDCRRCCERGCHALLLPTGVFTTEVVDKGGAKKKASEDDDARKATAVDRAATAEAENFILAVVDSCALSS